MLLTYSAMLYRFTADLVLVIHFAFVIFVCLGGLLLLKWRRLVWLHVPAFLWGVLIELAGWICPLTYLENWLGEQAGYAVYHESFIRHYIWPILYPAGLIREIQMGLGLFVLVWNVLIYTVFLRSGHRAKLIEHKSD